MTASFDTAPLRGQSLRGRPVHERCMPVNKGNQPLLRRRGGGGLATALTSGKFGAMLRTDDFAELTTTSDTRANEAIFRWLGGRDGTPVHVRLLGDDLVAFRDTAGKIALIREACPHRGASLFLARNEEHGLRCVYHGWKFDVEGNCVDMPSEPDDSTFKSKI